MTAPVEQIWIELPPISNTAPGRLMFFFHGEDSGPEEFVPVAIAWQLKFPGATVLIVQAPNERRGGTRNWYENLDAGDRRLEALQVVALRMATLIRQAQQKLGFPAETTMLVGYSQGANVVLELASLHSDFFGLAIAYSGRLLRSIHPAQRVACTVHLIHGDLNSRVPLVYGRQAFDRLKAAGADVTLDVLESGTHEIDQDMIILGTTRAMQSVFKRRKLARMRGLN